MLPRRGSRRLNDISLIRESLQLGLRPASQRDLRIFRFLLGMFQEFGLMT
jgi:hypothetical protein